MGQRRLDLVAEAARWLVERLGDRSASVTSSFPPSSWHRRRAVQGGRFWPRKWLDSAALVGGGGWWSMWGQPGRPNGLGCYPLPTPDSDGGAVATLGGDAMGDGDDAEGRGA
jgi:hypothetical protein